MNRDAFSNRHPLINFLFFLGAIGCGVLIQHPAYLLAGLVCACSYYLLLKGRAGWKLILGLMPLFVILTAVNPLFNTYGERILFTVFGRPYTLEALLYGSAAAGTLVVMMVWFGCYNVVLTSDKFTCLFGNLIPSLSLLLVMVLRMIPNLMRKARQFAQARKSVGKGVGENASTREKVRDGMTILSALTDWALEGSVVTGDSMRSRGYGTARRTSFMIYRMTGMDYGLLLLQLGLMLTVAVFAAQGGVYAEFTPRLQIAPLSGGNWVGFLAYGVYLLIPTVLHIKEDLQWRISRSKI